jgi:hypothetical protein
MLAINLSYLAFIVLRNIPSIPSFFSFYHEKVLNFVKFFLCIYWEDCVVFVLALVYMLYYIYRFIYTEPFLHHWNETNLVIMYDILDVLLNSVWQNFVENICIYIH